MSFNVARYVVVLGVLFFCFTYLYRSSRRWYPRWMVGVLVGLAIVWFPLKIVGSGIRESKTASDIFSDAVGYYQNAIENQGGGGDTQFLDMTASAMTLVDQHGQFFYGSAWAPLLYVAIPRVWWPDKPRMNEYMWEISTVDRPMGQIGMVPGLVGDCYLNFGYGGVVLIVYAVAWLYGRAYFRAMLSDHNTCRGLNYLMFLVAFIQVIRDGVISLVMFTFVAAAPIMVTILANVFANANSRSNLGAPLGEYSADTAGLFVNVDRGSPHGRGELDRERVC
jgi:hypothetical protein